MSLIPEDGPESAARSVSSEGVFPPPEAPLGHKTWPKRLFSVCFAIFTFEIGLFLMIFPWMNAWNINYMQTLVPTFWGEFYLRAAVTGLGFVNICIAGAEITRLIKRT